MKDGYQICTRCIMDTSDPEIIFDENGICNHCKRAEAILNTYVYDREKGKVLIDQLFEKMRKRRGKSDYDCIIGISGGYDSSYSAYFAKKLGLRVLGVHIDTGWNSEFAINNIEKLVKLLGIELYTFVIDWGEMRDLQLAFFKASLANCDVPQDHAIIAALYKVAKDAKIPFIISGHNHSTESILPSSWGYNPMDLRHIKSIQKRFGTMKLKKYPRINFFKYYIYYRYINKIEFINILNYISYNKKEAAQILEEDLGYRIYEGKHNESVFTRFFQGYYLPVKFGFDKRRAHLSSLVVTGQISREEALKEINDKSYSSNNYKEDKKFIVKKLGINDEEFDQLINLPPKSYKDYPSNYKFYEMLSSIMKLIRK